MNEYMRYAISKLINASNPAEAVSTVTALNAIGQDLCLEIALEDYERSSISDELVSLVNQSNSDLLPYFLNERIYFADNEIIDEMYKRRGENYNFEIDYSIVFDTNYASYISVFITNSDRLDEKVRKNLDILIRNNFRFDYMVYIIENFYNVFQKEGVDSETLKTNKANFYHNLLNLELFKNINIQKYIEHREITFNIDISEAYMLTDSLFNGILNSPDSKEGFSEYFEIYRMMMLYIIGILKVRFSSNKAPHNKMTEMFDFMNKVAGLYFEREIKFTYEYFESPQEFKMFDRIYRGINKLKLKEVIENIAWDFSIPRIIERFMKHASMTRYFIPLFLTHDANLKTVLNAYRVKGVLFNKDKTMLIPFSNINVLKYLEERNCKTDYEFMSSYEAVERRREISENNRKNGFNVIDKELDILVEVLKKAT